MYGKHFESMYEGSMYGAGLGVFAVWGFVIAHTKKSRVELNPRKLADTLGGTIEEIEQAINYLKSPDPKSRHKEHEGRKLIKEGEYQYWVPCWEFYQAIRNEDERREYNRSKQREYRTLVKSKNNSKKSKGTFLERQYIEAAKDGNEALCDELAASGIPDPPKTLQELNEAQDVKF